MTAIVLISWICCKNYMNYYMYSAQSNTRHLIVVRDINVYCYYQYYQRLYIHLFLFNPEKLFLIYSIQLILIASCFSWLLSGPMLVYIAVTTCPPRPHQFSDCCSKRYKNSKATSFFFCLEFFICLFVLLLLFVCFLLFLTGQKRKVENQDLFTDKACFRVQLNFLFMF